MSKFTIYQINLTDEQENEINTSESRPAFYLTYLDTIMYPTAKSVSAARDMYKPVAVIEAVHAEHCYTISNQGQEDAIERLAPMHTVSVGDVIVDENGKAVVVNRYSMDAVDF